MQFALSLYSFESNSAHLCQAGQEGQGDCRIARALRCVSAFLNQALNLSLACASLDTLKRMQQTRWHTWLMFETEKQNPGPN